MRGAKMLCSLHVDHIRTSAWFYFQQKDAAPPKKPTHGIIYVASSYPPWQHVTLTTLKEMYVKLGGNFPDNRDIMTRMKELPEIKSAMKKLMPFVQHVKVLEVNLDFCILHSSLLTSSAI